MTVTYSKSAVIGIGALDTRSMINKHSCAIPFLFNFIVRFYTAKSADFRHSQKAKDLHSRGNHASLGNSGTKLIYTA